MGGNARIAAAAAAGVAAGALVGTVAARAQRWYCLQILRTRSGIGRVHMVRSPEGEPVRVLQEDGVFQSATYLGDRCFEPVFAYYRGFDAMFEAANGPGHPARSVRRVLMIGGGGFAYPKHLLTKRDDIDMDVVEFDPAIVRAARRWFYLDELEARLADPTTSRGNRLRVIEEDGRAYLERLAAEAARPRAAMPAANTGLAGARGAGAAPESYDAIVNDAFTGREPAHGLSTVEAARAVHGCLAADGLYLENVVSRDDGRDVSFLRDRVATLLSVFAHVHVLQTSDAEFGGEDNYLVVATDGSARFAEAIAYDDDFPGAVVRD